MRLVVACFILTMLVSGCAALKTLEGEPDRDVFELRPPLIQAQSCNRGRLVELVVELPKTRGTLDTDRIMIRPNKVQVQYLPDARWGDTVPIALQALLVRTLGNYDVFTHVGRAPLGVAGDYALISEVEDFNAEVAGKGAIVKLTVDAQMVREIDALVVSRRHFTAMVKAPTTRTSDLIPAFDTAGQQIVAQMADWGLRAIDVNPAHCN